MNEDLKALFEVFKEQGVFQSPEEMDDVIKSEGIGVLYDALPEGMFSSPEEFESTFSQTPAPDPKKKDDTVSVGGDGSLEPVETAEVVPIEDAIIKDSFEDRDNKVGYVGSLVSSLDKGLYKNLIGNPVKGIGLLLEGATGPGFASDALIDFANYYNKTIDELTPQDEEFRGSLSDQFGQAFGQVAALAGTGFLSGAGKSAQVLQMAKAPTTVNLGKEIAGQFLNPVAVSGGMSMGASEFERAKQSGATDDEAFEAFYKNAAVGSVLERIPMMQFFKRFNKVTNGGVVNWVKTKATGGAIGGTEEMVTEVLQGLYANQTAKDIYNDTQDLLEGVGEAGGVGFGVGFLLNALGARAKLSMSQGNTAEAAAIEQAVKDFIKSNEDKTRKKEESKSLRDEIIKGSPGLSEDQVDRIEPLQKKVKDLAGNDTEGAKKSRKEYVDQINGIIEEKDEQVEGEQEVQEQATEEQPAEVIDEETQEVVEDTEAKSRKPGEKTLKKAEAKLPTPNPTSPPTGRIEDVDRSKKKVTVDEMAALKDQIKLEAKAARGENVMQTSAKNKVKEVIKQFQKKGSIAAKQAKTVIDRFSKVDASNPASLYDFIFYSEKVFTDADYNEKISTANKSKKSIKRYSKNTKNQATDNSVAKEFLKIDPKKVADVDEYNRIADMVKSMTAPGMARSFEARAQAAKSHNDIKSYIDKAKVETEQATKAKQMAMNEDLVEAGVIEDGMSAVEIQEVLNALEEDADVTDDKERYVAAYINKMKDVFTPIMDRIAKSDEDPFTGEKYDFDEKELDLIRRLAGIDFDGLDRTQQLSVIKAMANIQENGVFDNVENLLAKAEGHRDGQKFGKNNKAHVFKLLGKVNVPFVGGIYDAFVKMYGKDVMSIPLFTQSLYRSIGKANEMLKLSGFTDMIRGRRGAIVNTKKLIEDFKKKFKSDFSNEEMHEMSIYGFLMRTIPGNEQVEFARRKKILQQSIEDKKKSSDDNLREIGLAEEKIFNEKYADANSIEDLNPPKEIKEIIEWFQEEFRKIRPDLEDISSRIYNKLLDFDDNYLPDVYVKIDPEDKSTVDKIEEMKNSAFFENADVVNKKEASVLMRATKPSKLPNGRVLSSSFVSDMFRKLEDAQTDINTAAPIRKMEAFLDSQNFKDSFADPKDYQIMREKMIRSVAVAKNALGAKKSDIKKYLNTYAKMSSMYALGGVTQPFKQVLPILTNTFINLTGSVGDRFGVSFSPSLMREANELLGKSTVGTRGLSSELDIGSQLQKLEKEFSDTNVGKNMEKLSDLYLKTFLEKSDVWVARWSWMSYYAASLKDQGKIDSINDVNWSEEGTSPDNTAMTYADNQVDRQQNVSMQELQGMMYSNPTLSAQVLRKVFLPFSNFVFNMKSRIWTDVTILSSENSSGKDKELARKSLMGAGSEIVVFSAISTTISTFLWSAAADLLGIEEDDEEELEFYQERWFKSMATNAFVDIFSPAPPLDETVKSTMNWALQEAIFSEEFDPKKDFQLIEYNRDNSYGAYGIPAEKAKELGDFFDMSMGDSFSTKDFIGADVEKELSSDEKALMQQASAVYAMYLMGVAPVELGRLAMNIKNRLVRKAKEVGSGSSKKGGRSKRPSRKERPTRNN